MDNESGKLSKDFFMGCVNVSPAAANVSLPKLDSL